ncbi:hypothetical protein PQR75_32235 [Paraburkholderia fungorum]|uniref:hypothetical protein n=1 Tax=Paraburkholderia fungorum TaxID=134537 RepID=UPI0038BCA978
MLDIDEDLPQIKYYGTYRGGQNDPMSKIAARIKGTGDFHRPSNQVLVWVRTLLVSGTEPCPREAS